MGERYFFSKLITKDLTAVDSNRRLFEGVLTVEIKDRQGEITIRDELMKVLPIWIARGGPITDTHSNRVIGKGINYAATTVKDEEGTEYPAISIQGEIFKDYELDDEIWKNIKSGKYKGLSFGGATKSDRTPVLEKDGSVAYSLKDLEQYEVAVCEEPAVPLALIMSHNHLAKSFKGNVEDRGNGKVCVRCDKNKCYVDKNGEPFSDVQGANAPEGRTEQAEGLDKDKSSVGIEKPQDSPKSEELEADQSQGPNQENGATYRGTDKAKQQLYNDTIEELKGRHVDDSARYAEHEDVGTDKPPATPKLRAQDEDNKDALEAADLEEEKKLEYADGQACGPDRKNKILPLLAAGAKVLAGAARTGASAAGRAVGTAGRAGAESAAESIDPSCACSEPSCKADLPPDISNPGGSKYNETGEGGAKTDSYGNKMPKHGRKKPQDLNESNTRLGTKAPGLKESLGEFRSREGRPDYKPGSRPDTVDNKKWLASRRQRLLGTKKALEMLRLALMLKGGNCYNTDEVVREYCSEKDKEDKVIGEKKAILHLIDDVGNKWYAYEKTNTDSHAYMGEPPGGNWGREPGETRDDESKSPQAEIQPKHVNRPTNAEEADSFKEKTSADPQLQANNGDDGKNGSLRQDNDPPSEAFEKEKSTNTNDPGHGAAGIRAGASYDNAQQGTGAKDDPRKVVEEKYTGEEDSSGGETNARFNKSIILNTLILEAKKRFI